jgi:hypothetical protein
MSAIWLRLLPAGSPEPLIVMYTLSPGIQSQPPASATPAQVTVPPDSWHEPLVVLTTLPALKPPPRTRTNDPITEPPMFWTWKTNWFVPAGVTVSVALPALRAAPPEVASRSDASKAAGVTNPRTTPQFYQ